MIPDLYRRLILGEVSSHRDCSPFQHAHIEPHGDGFIVSTSSVSPRGYVHRDEFILRPSRSRNGVSCELHIVGNKYLRTTCGHCGGDLSEPVEDRDCATCDQEARERGEAARVDAAIDRAEATEAYR